MKKYIFGEDFMDNQDLISEKLKTHDARIKEIFEQVNPSNPDEIPLGRLKEIWL